MDQEYLAQALEQAPKRLTAFLALQLLFQVDGKSASRSPFRMSGVVDLLLKSGASRSVRLPALFRGIVNGRVPAR